MSIESNSERMLARELLLLDAFVCVCKATGLLHRVAEKVTHFNNTTLFRQKFCGDRPLPPTRLSNYKEGSTFRPQTHPVWNGWVWRGAESTLLTPEIFSDRETHRINGVQDFVGFLQGFRKFTAVFLSHSKYCYFPHFHSISVPVSNGTNDKLAFRCNCQVLSPKLLSASE